MLALVRAYWHYSTREKKKKKTNIAIDCIALHPCLSAKYLEPLIVLILNFNSFNAYYAFDTLTVTSTCLRTK